jgi:hypothetical protein
LIKQTSSTGPPSLLPFSAPQKKSFQCMCKNLCSLSQIMKTHNHFIHEMQEETAISIISESFQHKLNQEFINWLSLSHFLSLSLFHYKYTPRDREQIYVMELSVIGGHAAAP